jgi:hypothetical protein
LDHEDPRAASQDQCRCLGLRAAAHPVPVLLARAGAPMIDWILEQHAWFVAHQAQLAMAIVAVLAITTSIAMTIRAIIPTLSAIAKTTATKADDDAVTRLATWLDWFIVALDIVRRMPRIVVGPLPSTQPIATTIRPQPPVKALSVPPPGPPPSRPPPSRPPPSSPPPPFSPPPQSPPLSPGENGRL